MWRAWQGYAASPRVPWKDRPSRTLFAKACGLGEVLRKGRACQVPPEPARAGLWPAVPATDGNRGCGGGIGKHGPGEGGEFRQAAAGLGGVDELASGSEHLLRRQGELLHRPAVAVAVARGASESDVASSTYATPTSVNESDIQDEPTLFTSTPMCDDLGCV